MTDQALFAEIEAATAEAVGHKLFTLMAIDHARGEAARIYTSHPDDYPVGGRKPLGDLTDWGRIVLEGRQPWIATSMEDIRGAFFDHALIESLGCASCLNMPVIEEAADGPRVIGTMNLLHEAGWYAPTHVAILQPFAERLVVPFQTWAEGAE